MMKKYSLLIVDENEPNPEPGNSYAFRLHWDTSQARAAAEAEALAAEYAARHSLTGVIGFAWTEEA